MSHTSPPSSSSSLPTSSLPTIERDELRAKLERGEPFKLIMAVSEWGFRVKHIPGSLRFKTPDQAFAALNRDEPIVVYCSNFDCHASRALIEKLLAHGYKNVRHYEGGLIDWENAGLPIEGDWAEAPPPSGATTSPVKD
jgi:rhodanese-related sulfurtransferase